MSKDKVLENRLRRMADRQGYQLSKIRRRDPLAYDYGKYLLIDKTTNAALTNSNKSGNHFSLEEVEILLNMNRRQQ
jgi:hypothetical protein